MVGTSKRSTKFSTTPMWYSMDIHSMPARNHSTQYVRCLANTCGACGPPQKSTCPHGVVQHNAVTQCRARVCTVCVCVCVCEHTHTHAVHTHTHAVHTHTHAVHTHTSVRNHIQQLITRTFSHGVPGIKLDSTYATARSRSRSLVCVLIDSLSAFLEQ